MEIEKKRKRESDRISNLPEFLIHQILSYLPPKEAARTTALNKTWLQSYSTSPTLTFAEYLFPRSQANRHPFFNFVNNTLLRYTRLNLRIHKLFINVFHVDHEPAYRLLLDESLRVAFDNGVQELALTTFQMTHYTLPSAMFDSLKLLTYLRVDRFKFPQNNVSNPKCNSINFPFLHTLDISRAYIDDGMLQKLLSSSPSLENIVFFYVFGFNKFRVCNLGRLKSLDIRTLEIIEVEIENAPSLHLLKYVSCSQRPYLLKLGSALQNQSLKHLELHSVSISDISLKLLITKCSLLEHLEIHECDGLEGINIVSDSLKHLKIMDCKNLVEAEIDAPILLELDYFGENGLSLSLTNTPEELITSIYLRDFGTGGLTDAWFCQLRELLKSLNRARVSFTSGLLGIKFVTTLDLIENPLPLTENYMPEMSPSSPSFAVFVNKLFSSFRPTSIYSRGLTGAFVDFMKFLSSELMIAIRNSNCCSSDQTKCWRHYLKDIEVEVYEDSQKVWQPLHQEETLQSEFTFHHKIIRFNLEWYTTLNVQV